MNIDVKEIFRVALQEALDEANMSSNTQENQKTDETESSASE